MWEVGNVLDVFIAKKISKVDKMSDFVRYIQVPYFQEPLHNLCDLWICYYNVFTHKLNLTGMKMLFNQLRRINQVDVCIKKWKFLGYCLRWHPGGCQLEFKITSWKPSFLPITCKFRIVKIDTSKNDTYLHCDPLH